MSIEVVAYELRRMSDNSDVKQNEIIALLTAIKDLLSKIEISVDEITD